MATKKNEHKKRKTAIRDLVTRAAPKAGSAPNGWEKTGNIPTQLGN